jgi:SAM-dependent methyltransferase
VLALQHPAHSATTMSSTALPPSAVEAGLAAPTITADATTTTVAPARMDARFWNAYYAFASQGDNPLTDAPSSFVHFCSPHVRPGGKVVEFGCGNGRDARWFVGQGCAYIGLDASTAAVDRCRASIVGQVDGADKAWCTLQTGDFADPDLLGAESATADVVYSRFTLHSVTDEQETRTVANAFRLLKAGGRFMLEARSTRDPRFGVGRCVAPNAYVDTHYRRFLELDVTISKCEAAGFEVVIACEEMRAANFLGDKAVVVRIIAVKPALTARGPAGQVATTVGAAVHQHGTGAGGEGGGEGTGRENVAPPRP